MINYFNFNKFRDKYLITNDLGRYAFVDNRVLKELVKTGDTSDLVCRDNLVHRGFIVDSSVTKFIEENKVLVERSKSYLYGSTSLFIFVLTNSCNMACVYCQAQSDQSEVHGLMSYETAERAADIVLSSPSKNVSIEFQGGEPLLNFNTLKHVVEYVNKNNKDKHIEFNVVSNLTLLTDEIASYLATNHIRVSVSLDGDAALHNTNRKYRKGGGTFGDAISGLKLMRRYGAVPGAIQTTTRYSLNHYKEIIDTYIEYGFRSVFLRPLTPLGYANETWDEIGYSEEEFLTFYRNSLNYIIEKNNEGIPFTEGHALLMLEKIINGDAVNYMELRSPCGAGLGQMAFYYNGSIFTCDEGRMLSEMGNDAFKLGNVNDATYESLIESKTCKAVCSASVLESLPSCTECVYSPYCGVCPVINYALEKDLISRKYRSVRCGFYKGILDTLFGLLYNEDEVGALTLKKWVSYEERL